MLRRLANRTVDRGLRRGKRGSGRPATNELPGAVVADRSIHRLLGLLVTLATLLILIQVTPAQAEPTPVGMPGTWYLKVNEEFSSAGLNTALWTPGWQSDASISGPMSNECLASKNVSQPGNGYLYLQVRKEHATCGSTTVEDTGGLIESNPSDGQPGHSGFAYTYGAVEWEAYTPGVSPTGRGCPKGGCLPDWPALWSLASTNTDEIDTMEGLETLGKACYHIHPPPGAEGPGACLSGSYAGWHKFASEWEPGVVKYFYDGAQVGELSAGILNGTPQYLIANMVPPGCCNQPLVVPDEMVVNYVRVWQRSAPPTTTTGAASGVLEEQATLTGSVNPNNAETKYHFQYGPTAEYGKATPEDPAGAGTGSVEVSAPLENLAENTTYHYRLVATNADGTIYGHEQTFTTPYIHTTPIALREAGTGDQWVYYVGKTHSIWEWTWNGSAWVNSHPGGTVAPGSNLAATRSPSSGEQWVYSIGGTTGTSVQQEAWSGSKWGLITLGGEAAPNTSPAAVREESTGYQWVYYAGKESDGDNSIWEFTWNGSSWVKSHPGGFIASNTSPAFVRSSASGNQWVYYVGGGDSAIWQAAWNGKEWIQTRVGGEVAPNSSPVVLREEGTGYQWLYYVNKANGAIEEFTWNGSTWTATPTEVGGLVEANSSLAVAREASTGYQWVYYVGGGDGAVWEWTWNGSQWVSSRPGSLVASNTSPAVVQPYAGYQWVYYQGSNDPIMQLFWNGSTWGEIAP